MTKSKLIKNMIKLHKNIPSVAVTSAVHEIFEHLSTGLIKGHRIELRGFGSFSIRIRTARNNARNPKTNQIIKVSSRRVPYFRMGKEFKELIN